jgi:hypothetical protein
MAEVTYYVALPFVAGDDGVAAGEPTEPEEVGNHPPATAFVGRSMP